MLCIICNKENIEKIYKANYNKVKEMSEDKRKNNTNARSKPKQQRSYNEIQRKLKNDNDPLAKLTITTTKFIFSNYI